MQTKEANDLQAAWGNKPCDHPHFEKEYFNGSDTGDYACTHCGESFPRAKAERMMAERDGS